MVNKHTNKTKKKMSLLIGLVVKDGKQFIDKWIECVERLGYDFVVVDNGADKEVKAKLLNHPQMAQYHIQSFKNRNQSRDYQKILEMAREEKADWVWNLDIDEYVPELNPEALDHLLLNCTKNSVGFPLVEMRGDDQHYVLIKQMDGEEKDARLVHKIYKVLSHYEFDKNDIHGCCIPHNCSRDVEYVPVFIQHFGHYTKELRAEKRKRLGHEKDEYEGLQSWMIDDDSKVIIKHWDEVKNK